MGEPPPPTVGIDDAPLTIDEVVAIAGGAPVALGPLAFERIRASRAVVDRLVAGEELVYGLNTGLGHARDERVSREVLEAYQEAIVRTHAGGFGGPLPTVVVRAAIAVRVAGIARGGSGATVAAAETLVAMLNAGVHPVVPEVGSVGASDLMHMAAIALVAIGEGEAEVRGERLSGAEALARAGIAPLHPAPKDGLALISANGVSIGHGALVVDRARRLVETVDLVAGLSLEAIGGNPSIVEPAVAAAKPVAGQAEAAEHLRALLAGSAVCVPGGLASVQDPLSFRVVPQVHGALREFVSLVAAAVEAELAAMDDNPLVVIGEDRMISNGNFHPIVMALAFDALRPAIAHVGQLSERRLAHIWDALWKAADLTSAEAMREATAQGGALLRYAAAARYADLRALAGPATLDIPPLDLGVEDHATNAPATVRRTEEALNRLDDILAVELVMARLLLSRIRGDRPIGAGNAATLAALDRRLGEAAPGAGSAAIHAAVAELVREGIVAGG
jgi:histidine ammonia-lyase